MKLPRISTFTYDGKPRVAIERGPDPRGCGLFCNQLSPEVGPRTFKPEKMMDCRQLGLILTLFHLAKSLRRAA